MPDYPERDLLNRALKDVYESAFCRLKVLLGNLVWQEQISLGQQPEMEARPGHTSPGKYAEELDRGF